MNGLDLFSGIGGISLALEEWVTPILYVERDKYAQSVLLSRMVEGSIATAPIFRDVTRLDGRRLTKPVDIIYGGFPCQDISVAGRGKGLAGERSGLFYEIVRLTKEIRPSFVFLENVPAIRTRGLEQVIKEYTQMGYDCRWTCISASSVGANHKRERWFFLAYTDSSRRLWKNAPQSEERRYNTQPIGSSYKLSNSSSKRLERQREEPIGVKKEQYHASDSSWWKLEPDVGGTFNGVQGRLDGSLYGIFNEQAEKRAEELLQELQCPFKSKALQWATRRLDCFQAENFLFSVMREYEKGNRLPRGILEGEKTPEEFLREMQDNTESPRTSLRSESLEQYFREHPNALRILSRLVASRGETPWSNPLWEGSVPRVGKNIPNRVDRIKCLGNSVVPLQVKEAFKLLSGL